MDKLYLIFRHCVVIFLVLHAKRIAIVAEDVCNNKMDCPMQVVPVTAGLTDKPHPRFGSANYSDYLNTIQYQWELYPSEEERGSGDCAAHYDGVIENDLKVWKESNGISHAEFDESKILGLHYKIINHTLYRQRQCVFDQRCKGVEHFILEIIKELPNMEIIINVFDNPKVS